MPGPEISCSIMSIADNLLSIQNQIHQAATSANRQPENVRLIAVSKTKPVSLIKEAITAGQLDFGENRVQELREKQELLPDVRWHMIGTLQRNKVKYIAPYIYLIHSVDSKKLLTEINKEAQKNDRIIDCLLQINISDEKVKSGMEEEEAKAILQSIGNYPNVRIKGFMGMAAFISDEVEISRQFRRLRLARESFQGISHPRIQLEELSMGMSGDFELAIAEGATMVRIGSAVFGSR